MKQGKNSKVTETRRHSSKSGRLANKLKKDPLVQTRVQQFQQQVFPLKPSGELAGQLPCIVAVGGIDLESIDPDTPGKYLFGYHSQSNRWSLFTSPMKKYLHHHGVGMIDGKLYIVG